jgi:hypothetical protein
MLPGPGGHVAHRRLAQLAPSGLEDPVPVSRFVIPADGLFMGRVYLAGVLAL